MDIPSDRDHVRLTSQQVELALGHLGPGREGEVKTRPDENTAYNTWLKRTHPLITECFSEVLRIASEFAHNGHLTWMRPTEGPAGPRHSYRVRGRPYRNGLRLTLKYLRDARADLQRQHEEQNKENQEKFERQAQQWKERAERLH